MINRRNHMKRILITGSTDGVGRATAEALLDEGHQIVVHARTTARLAAHRRLHRRRGRGDRRRPERSLDEVHDLTEQANSLGPFDAVVHNAGVMQGAVLPVNVTAPYLMTAGGSSARASCRSTSAAACTAAATPTSPASTRRQARDALVLGREAVRHHAHGRRRPAPAGRRRAAVDPGWVPTEVGGPGASDDLALAHVTQVWLATTADPEALVSGRYWHHQTTEKPHPAVQDGRIPGCAPVIARRADRRRAPRPPRRRRRLAPSRRRGQAMRVSPLGLLPGRSPIRAGVRL